MKPVYLEHQIAASPKTVMATATDFENCSEFISGIVKVEMLTEGPVGLGTRFRETRIMFKREATEEMEITSFDSDSGYTLSCESCGARYQSTFKYEPKDGGTLMSMTMVVTPLTFMAKVMGFLMAPMMKKMCGEILRDFEEIGAHAVAREGA